MIKKELVKELTELITSLKDLRLIHMIRNPKDITKEGELIMYTEDEKWELKEQMDNKYIHFNWVTYSKIYSRSEEITKKYWPTHLKEFEYYLENHTEPNFNISQKKGLKHYLLTGADDKTTKDFVKWVKNVAKRLLLQREMLEFMLYAVSREAILNPKKHHIYPDLNSSIKFLIDNEFYDTALLYANEAMNKIIKAQASELGYEVVKKRDERMDAHLEFLLKEEVITVSEEKKMGEYFKVSDQYIERVTKLVPNLKDKAITLQEGLEYTKKLFKNED